MFGSKARNLRLDQRGLNFLRVAPHQRWAFCVSVAFWVIGLFWFDHYRSGKIGNGSVMKDYQAQLEKLRRDAAESRLDPRPSHGQSQARAVRPPLQSPDCSREPS